MSYKTDFICTFGSLFTADAVREHGEGCGIESMELNEARGIVTIRFLDGTEKYVNILDRSLMCAVYDIARTVTM